MHPRNLPFAEICFALLNSPLYKAFSLSFVSYDVLRGYEGEDIEIQLPDNLTVYDIDYLAIWCVQYRHNFGHVMIPQASELWVPPALGQTRIKVSIFAFFYFSLLPA